MALQDEFYTLAETARLLKVSKDTVRRWLKAGTLKGIRPGGPKLGWRIRGRDIEAFLTELERRQGS